MLITEFFSNREVFITGGTGFLGKALIEKLLRDVPKIKVLYILLRGKRNLTVEERLKQLKKDKVFDRIHQECPEVLNKLHAIQGDSQELVLGIKASDLELMKNVSMIFHMAANVKFDDPFRSSILLNSRGTLELLKIAENLKNLVVFMHCSTAFCNPFNEVVDEKVYKMPVDWRTTIKIAETYDEETISALCPKYTGHYPNTYTFTKNLSEQIIQEYSAKLPIVIIRPSIVLSAYKEPVPGWVDNMNGVLAAMVALSVGILPMTYTRGSVAIDCVPIDIVTKLTLVAAYKRGMQHLRKETIPNDLEVVNCAMGEFFHLTMERGVALYIHCIRRNPMENCIWYYSSPWLSECYYNFLLNILMTNLPLGLLVDNILRLMGRKPLLMKLTRRIMYTMKATCFFALRDYLMVNKNMINLDNYVPESETDKFGALKDAKDADLIAYFDSIVCGVKYNFFNQSPQASDGTRKRYKTLIIINQTIQVLVFGSIILFLWLFISKI